MTGHGLSRGAPLGCLVLAALAGAPAAAQSRVTLQGGFVPDPWAIEVGATGAEAAAARVHGCPGFVASAPALVVRLAAPVRPLRIHGHGEGVAGLVVEGPDGVLRCAPADAGGIATLRVDPVRDGEHAIWPAADAPGLAVAAQLLVSERDLDPDELLRAFALAPTELAVAAPPAFGLHPLPADGGLTFPVTLSGVTGADLAGPGCYGRIDPSRPDAVLLLEAPEEALAIRVRADVDTTLIVVAPDGTTHCDDDSYGFDPEVSLAGAAAGEWAIWAGVYSGSGGETATLEISRSAGGGAGAATDGLAADAEPAAGRHDLPATGTLSIPITLSGGSAASAIDWSCAGQIDPSRPDAVIRLSGDEPGLMLRARSREDTTMLVQAPDGAILCDDDSYGLDPAVRVEPAAAGDYAVWVGIFAGSGGGAAMLSVGRAESEIAGGGLEAAFDFSGPEANPFEGRTLASAVEALGILMEEHGLAEVLSFDRLEEVGHEGFVLHGVSLADPSGDSPPLAMGRLSITDVDLEGLAATGQPSRFALALEDVDYAALVEAGEAFEMPALPLIAGRPPLSLNASLLPAAGADAAKRDFSLAVRLDGEFALGFAARLGWPESGGAPASLEEATTEAFTLEFENRGFLGALLRAQAAEMGMEPGQVVAMALGGLTQAFDPLLPGSPQARLIEVLGAAFADPDQPGVIRMHLATDEPQGIDSLLEELQGGLAADPRVTFELTYEPMP